jgi:hypothetical protein|tara:strand:+ start:64 stop:225 length:162 start_codon:yes stop_codon:yes gene_type:complete
MGIPSRSCEGIESNKLDETLFISINGVWDLSFFGFYNNSNCIKLIIDIYPKWN